MCTFRLILTVKDQRTVSSVYWSMPKRTSNLLMSSRSFKKTVLMLVSLIFSERNLSQCGFWEPIYLLQSHGRTVSPSADCVHSQKSSEQRIDHKLLLWNFLSRVHQCHCTSSSTMLARGILQANSTASTQAKEIDLISTFIEYVL